MSARIGTGPVFEYEWLIGSRRWQAYGVRSIFVAALLFGMVVVAFSDDFSRSQVSIRALASTGTKFSQVLVGIQLALVLLAAPAATAGAVCLDKARGTLTHLFVTDLSDAEIVLGKLAARLVPVLGLVGCSVPVMLIATLLGGADPAGLIGVFATSIGLAFFGCTFALALSVWGKQTHEVLLAAYLAISGWLLFEPSWNMARSVSGSGTGIPTWVANLNPFLLCYGNAMRPASVRAVDYLIFLVACLGLSTVLAALSVSRIRAVTIRQQSAPAHKPRRRSRVPFTWFANRWRALPGPSLDVNPVLWREWHRNRPSHWSRICWLVYILVAGGFSGFLILEGLARRGGGGPQLDGMAAFTNGFQVAMGLLLLTHVWGQIS